jgi:hypothetical protein
VNDTVNSYHQKNCIGLRDIIYLKIIGREVLNRTEVAIFIGEKKGGHFKLLMMQWGYVIEEEYVYSFKACQCKGL